MVTFKSHFFTPILVSILLVILINFTIGTEVGMRLYLFYILSLGVLLNSTVFAQDQGPFPFIPNEGQWNEAVEFKVEFQEAAVFFEKNALHYQLIQQFHDHPGHSSKEHAHYQAHIFKTIFLNANEQTNIVSKGESPYYYNYFIGNKPEHWRSKVHLKERIEYQELYSAINLHAYVNKGHLKYDYHVKVGGDPSQIQFRYEGVNRPKIREGRLVIKHSFDEFIEEKPYAYQLIGGDTVPVSCNYVLSGEVVSFEMPDGYNTNYDLIIDPDLIFSTYTGSVADNFGLSGTYDANGNGYMGGIVFGNNYIAQTGVVQPNFAGPSQTVDIGIAKIAKDGITLEYATFLGGTSNETVHSMVADRFENLYIFGVSSSADYPMTSDGYDTTKATSSTIETETINNSGGNVRRVFTNGTDIVISKLNKDGTVLMGSTFFGGDGVDGLNYAAGTSGGVFPNLNYNYGDSHRGEIVLDSNNNVFVGTSTRSTDLDTNRGVFKGVQDGLILKFSNNLDSLIWSKYLGGSNKDAIYSLKITPKNQVLIGGGTNSYTDFPTTNGSYQSNAQQGRTDGFIALISEDGRTIERSTYLGTDSYDQVYFIDFDRFNNIYAFGQTRDTAFPIINSTIANKGGGQFFVKLKPELDSVLISSPFGAGDPGTINISPTAFLVDRCFNMYASGWGGSIVSGEGLKEMDDNMPLSSDAFRSTTDSNDFYLYVINGDADELFYGSFIGGTRTDDHVDGGTSRFDKDGIIYQSVCASCGGDDDDFPRKNAYSNTNNSNNCNNALFKFDFEILPVADFRTDRRVFCLNDTTPDSLKLVTITNLSKRADQEVWNFYGTQVRTNFSDTTILIDSAGTYLIQQIVLDTVCATDDTVTAVIIARPDDIVIDLQTDTLVCIRDSVVLTASTQQKANQFTWSRSDDFSDPIGNNDSSITAKLNPGLNTFYVLSENPIRNSCEKVDSVTVRYTPVTYSATVDADTVCEGSPINFQATLMNVDSFRWDFNNGIVNTSQLDTSIRYPVGGDYMVSFEIISSFCEEKDTLLFPINVQQNDLGFSTLSDTLFCGPGAFRVSKASSGSNRQFLWSSNSDFTDTLNSSLNDSTFFISQNDSGKYYFKVFNQYCEQIDSLNAEYVQYDLQLADLIESACTPFQTELQTTIVGTDSFRIQWGTNFSTSDSTPSVNFTQAGVIPFALIGSNAKCGIQDTLRDTLTLFPGVELQTINDTTICNGVALQLVGRTDGTANTFIWDTSPTFNNPLNPPTDSALNVTISQNTTYYLRASNALCDLQDTVEVAMQNVEVDVNDAWTICLEDTLSIEAQIIEGTPPLNFLWEPTALILRGQGSNQVRIAPSITTEIRLTSTDNIGCEDRDTLEVEVNTPAFDDATIFSDPDSAFVGQKVQLSTNRNGANLIYQWYPPLQMNNAALPNPVFSPQGEDSVHVSITDMNTTCIVEAFLRIKVFEVNCDEPDIFVPTAFTPNNDGNNDILYVRGANLSSIEFQLYNRWGELVFESTDINKGWDGTYKGKAVDPDVFTYQLRAICFDGQDFYDKGNITLIR